VKELPGSGAPDELIEALGISARHIANAVRAMIAEKARLESAGASSAVFVDAESAWIRENDNRGGGDLRPDSFLPGKPTRVVSGNRLAEGWIDRAGGLEVLSSSVPNSQMGASRN